MLRPKNETFDKIIWVGGRGRWFKRDDLMREMNPYTVMDMSLDDMVDLIDEIPALQNFFETTRHPIIFNERIGMHARPYMGEATGNFEFSSATRKNTWYGFKRHQHYLNKVMKIDSVGNTENGNMFNNATDYFEDHLQVTVPEFYKKTILSNQLEGMPQDAPFRYQGAEPNKLLTEIKNLPVGDLEFNAGKNLETQNGRNRLDKIRKYYGMAIARAYLLEQRLPWLREQLVESLDWTDTQGDDFAYDGTQTAVQDE